MDEAERRRRALSGDFGEDAQRIELARIAGESGPPPTLLSRRQATTIAILCVLLLATIVAFAGMRHFVKHQ
jgi:hypothetical protein